MTITHLTSTAELDEYFRKAGRKISVIDFHATWCGPCHAIAPTYESLAKEYPSINFFKCDVDQAGDIAQRYSVNAMPTFIFFKGNTKIDQVRGANRGALQEAVQRCIGGATDFETFSGKGRTLSDNTTANSSSEPSANPQLKVLGLLMVAYICFWYFSS